MEEKNKPTLIMMVGLPSSGKSTLARIIHNKKGYLHISSDNIRKELLGSEESQEDNQLVFDTMRKRTIEALKNGQSVVYDSTNISSKRRKGFLKQLPKGVEKECIYVCTDYYDCLDRDLKRNRTVGKQVIDKMFKNLQIPMKHEGWDMIKIHREKPIFHVKFPKLTEISLEYYTHILQSNKMLRGNIDLAQDSSYHSLSVHRHMYASYQEAKEMGYSKDILFVSLFHDIGKSWVKNFKEGSKYANFYGHENISAQLTLAICIDMGIVEDGAIYLATLVQLHTKVMQITKESPYGEKLKLFKEEVGGKVFNELMKLHTADFMGK